MNGYLLAIILIILFWAAVYLLDKKGFLAKHNMSAWGPIVMWRTKRGVNLIDKLSRPHRFWNAFSLLSKGIIAFVMFGMTALLLWEATIVTQTTTSISPEMILGIPGLNPIIPLWYGILGFIVAVVIHEFAHGILARVHGMKVKSLGIVWMLIPIGAFTEPDEEALSKAERKKRTAVYAVGPGINVVVAVVFAVLFTSMAGSVTAEYDDAPLVYTIYEGTPSDLAGIPLYSQIVSISYYVDGELITAEVGDTGIILTDENKKPLPNTKITVTYYYNGELTETEAVSGLIIYSSYQSLPAGEAGLKSGMMIYSINGEIVYDYATFNKIMSKLTPYETVSIVAYQYNSSSGEYELAEDVTEVTPITRYDYYEMMGYSTEGVEDGAFIGVGVLYMGMYLDDPSTLIESIANPFADDDSLYDYFRSFLVYITLPLSGFQPFPDELVATFSPTGILAGMSNESFWVLTNCCYWIFWINLMLGLTNALPAVPLDGGYIFRDWLDSVVQRLRKNMPEKERTVFVDTVTWAFAFFILILLMWQIIGSYL